MPTFAPHATPLPGPGTDDPRVPPPMDIGFRASDDDGLLAAWRAGDEGAFATLVGRHHRVVRAACRRQLPERDVDDAVQAVFLVLARRPAAAARAPVLAAWLLRVAHLAARDLHRRERRRRRAESLAVPPGAPGHAPDTVQLDRLDAALMALRPAQRDAVVLHVVGGAAPAEVAERLGTSRDHAYKLIQRGLAGLRARLGGALPTTAALAAVLAPADGADGTGLVPVLTGTPSARAQVVAAAIGSGTAPWLMAATGAGLAAGLAIALLHGAPGAMPAPGTPVAADRMQAGMDLAAIAPATTVTEGRSPETGASRGSGNQPEPDDRPVAGPQPGVADASVETEPPRITMKVIEMGPHHAAAFLDRLSGSRITVDPLLNGRRVSLDLVDIPFPEAVAELADASDADVEALPGGGYHLRARPAPRAQ